MKKWILGTAVFFTFACKAQEPVSAQKLTEDYDVFRGVFESANAGLYKYHSKREVDSVFSANRKRITKKTSYRDFYTIVWDVIDYTGSCHNRLNYPDSLDKAISSRSVFFPVPLKWVNGKLYSNFDNPEIPLGSEILSVNKLTAGEFAKKTSKYLSTDGHNMTGKYAFLETDWFPFFCYLAMGEQRKFNVKYQKDGVVHNATLKAVDYKTTLSNFKGRFVPEYEKKRKKSKYSIQWLDETTGLLTVRTFGMGGPSSEGHRKYAAFLDSVFVDLKNKGAKNIIVDVRGNGGGNDPNDLLLYSYLTQRDFRENTAAFTLFNTVPLKQYFVEEEENEIRDLEEMLREEHPNLQAGKYYQNDSINPVWNPNPNAFQGKVYLLISPLVASAGSLFASLVKSDEQSVVIGEETVGGYYGHTGHIPVTYRLPNTQLLLSFSIVDLEQDVKQLPDQKYGDGVKPDYPVELKIEDYLNSVDTVLEFAKQQLMN